MTKTEILPFGSEITSDLDTFHMLCKNLFSVIMKLIYSVTNCIIW